MPILVLNRKVRYSLFHIPVIGRNDRTVDHVTHDGREFPLPAAGGAPAPQTVAYLQASHLCPYCHSNDISGGPLERNDDHVYQDITCHACGRSWTDEYTLTGLLEAEP